MTTPASAAGRPAVWVESLSVLHPRASDPAALAAAAAGEADPAGAPTRVPGPDVGVLGERGLRHLDRATLLLLVGLEAVLPPLIAAGARRDRTGLFMGTALGGLGSIVAFARDAVLPDPLAANPGQFQGTVLNAPVGRAMIRHGLVGPTATFSTSAIASADAIDAAAEAVADGRLDRAVAGGFESVEDPVAEGAARVGAVDPAGPPLTEAVATLVLGGVPPRSGRPVRVAGTASACAPGGSSGASARAAAAARRVAGFGADPVDLLLGAGPGAASALSGAGATRRALDVTRGLGECLGTDAALAAIVAVHELAAGRAGRRALVVVEGCGFGAAIAFELG